jgi:hypothetical protein
MNFSASTRCGGGSAHVALNFVAEESERNAAVTRVPQMELAR